MALLTGASLPALAAAPCNTVPKLAPKAARFRGVDCQLVMRDELEDLEIYALDAPLLDPFVSGKGLIS